jgi:endonuclease YncB( thermonuclease family)
MQNLDNIIETIEELEIYDSNTPFFNFCGEVHLAKVVKCYDGDTIHCIFKISEIYRQFKIRMYEYDAPEMKPSKLLNNRDQIKNDAIMAKMKLEELILNKYVYLFCKGLDKYGRILGIIKINKDDVKSVNDIMLEGGFGYEYYGGTKQ